MLESRLVNYIRFAELPVEVREQRVPERAQLLIAGAACTVPQAHMIVWSGALGTKGHWAASISCPPLGQA
jgi:hypothetical protein